MFLVQVNNCREYHDHLKEESRTKKSFADEFENKVASVLN